MLSTMKPSMQADIAELQSAANFGRLMAVFLWVYGAMSPFAGMIADKFSKKWLIVISLFVWSGVTLSMGYATSFEQLYWLRAFMGVSEAVYFPAALSLIADFHTSRTRSLAVGIHLTGLYVGQGLGGFGATIAESFSWNTAFYFFGWIGIIYSLLLIFFLRDDHHSYVPATGETHPIHENPAMFRGLGILLGNISFWIILFYFAVPGIPGWGVKNWLPTLLSQNLGYRDEQGRTNINNYHCRIFFTGCDIWRLFVRQVGTSKYKRKDLYRGNWYIPDYSGNTLNRLWQFIISYHWSCFLFWIWIWDVRHQ